MITPELERAMLSMADAHAQWEQENNRLGGDVVWTIGHLELLARTVLLSLMEPSEGMMRAGGEAIGSEYPGNDPYDATSAFRAMIQHILGES